MRFLTLKDYLPDLALGPAALSLAAGIGVCGLLDVAIKPVSALISQGAAIAIYICAAARTSGKRQRNLDMSPDAVKKISAFLGCCLLALFFCLGFFQQGRASWPRAGAELPEGFPIAGEGVVEEVKALGPGAYTGPRYQITVRILEPGVGGGVYGTKAVKGGQGESGKVGEDLALWRRQRKILLSLRFARDSQGEARGEDFGRKCLPGARIRFDATIRQGEKPRNPGEFDYTKYLRTKGIYCRGEADEGDISLVRKPPSVQRFIAGLRKSVVDQAERCLDPKAAAVIAGCLLGDQSLMEREDREVYRQAGIAHLFAVSGTHGGILLSLALHLEQVGPFRKRKKISRILALGLLLFYLGLTGFPLSMRRTFFMACMMQGAALLGRKGDTLGALAAAAFVLLWLNPQALFSAGFQLSFGVTWGIIHLSPWLRRRLPALIAVPAAAQLAAMPAQAYWFYQIQPAGFLINLLAVSLMPPLLILSGLASLAGLCGQNLAALLWQAPGLLAMVLDRGAKAWTSLPFASLNVRGYPWPTYVLGGLALWLLPGAKAKETALDQWLYQRNLRKRRQVDWERWEDWRGEKQRQIKAKQEKVQIGETSLPSVFSKGEERPDAALLIWRKRKPAGLILTAISLALVLLLPGPLRLFFLDVGQGDGLFFVTPSGNTWMIDGGSGSVSQLAAYRLEPFLRSQGVNRLDYIVLSHMDEDHISGIRELLAAGWRAGCLIVSPQAQADEKGKELIALAGQNGVKVVYLSKGQVIRDGGMILRCLHPGKDRESEDNNEACLVLQLRYKDFSLLLTGDIDSAIEEELKDEWSGTSLLKVAHHGSKYSTGEDFLARVKPSASVISSGKKNVYGHPHPDTLERLKEAGSQIFLTMDKGAVKVTTSGKGFRISCFLDE